MKFGDFELSVVRECLFKLDGGAMFGVVPKVMWGKVAPSDEHNRVQLACNLILVETGKKRVLIETGMGDRWSERDLERYDVKRLVDSGKVLSDLGLRNEDIDAVVISHLHFDHAGGAVRLVDGKLVPTFPNARYFIQRGEFEHARRPNPNPRAKGSYRADDIEPLREHGAIEIIDGDFEIYPGVWCKITGGHTSHHQVVYLESAGKKAVFFADIIPTVNHVSPPWVMGYDHFPLQTCDLKSSWLNRAAREEWLVIFDHEPGVPWGHVKLVDETKFVFEPLPEDSLAFRPSKRAAAAG